MDLAERLKTAHTLSSLPFLGGDSRRPRVPHHNTHEFLEWDDIHAQLSFENNQAMNEETAKLSRDNSRLIKDLMDLEAPSNPAAIIPRNHIDFTGVPVKLPEGFDPGQSLGKLSQEEIRSYLDRLKPYTKIHVDWRALLGKFIAHVKQCEGFDYREKINDHSFGSDMVFTTEEVEALDSFEL